MLGNDADSGPTPVATPELPQPRPPRTPSRPQPSAAETPDRDVLDSARFRLTFHEAVTATTPQAERSTADLRAVHAVLGTIRADPLQAADPLDVGAGLVLLTNLRLHLDHLEAGRLGTAQPAGLSWDLIAAILGIPAAEACDRLHALRARPEPA
jgi:hypothetical protein